MIGSDPARGIFFCHCGMYTVRYPGANSTMVDFGDRAFNTSSLASYVYSLPNEVARVDVFASVIFLILLYAGIIIVQKLTTVLLLVLKKVFLLIIVSLAFFEFMRMFALKLSLEGLSTGTILFGAAGFVIGVVAFSIALYVAFRSLIVLQKSEERPAEVSEGETLPGIRERGDTWEPQHDAEISPGGEPDGKDVVPAVTGTGEDGVPVPIGSRIRNELSVSALKNDKRIGAVIAYIIIAEFGVFSSKTTAAPSIETGMAFFCIFLLASLLFIRLTYHDYWKGVRHLAAAVLIGGLLSIVLGFFWGGIPPEQLLSLNYFTSDALVALVTGLALSLFMGSIG